MGSKTTHALKEFRYAILHVMQDGKPLVGAYLQARKPAVDGPPESKQAEFYIAPTALPDAEVTIFAYPEPLTGIGYRLKMKDFLPVPGVA